MLRSGWACSGTWYEQDFYISKESDYLMMHPQNPLTRAAQTSEGQAVVVKVLAIRDEGHECLDIIRKTSAGPLVLLSNNHCLPLIKEFVFEDIMFGVFPKTDGSFEEAWGSWTRNSVGDILDMLLQILEVITFCAE